MITSKLPTLQCDPCSRLTTRLHYCEVGGLETWACDECFDYDPEAYDEPPAIYTSPPKA
jgi:hypothetical protein